MKTVHRHCQGGENPLVSALRVIGQRAYQLTACSSMKLPVRPQKLNSFGEKETIPSLHQVTGILSANSMIVSVRDSAHRHPWHVRNLITIRSAWMIFPINFLRPGGARHPDRYLISSFLASRQWLQKPNVPLRPLCLPYKYKSGQGR